MKKRSRNVPDRFSDLPQDLVHRILSFLCTEDVIKTGILSKTFMSIWRSFPVLNFPYCKFRDDDDDDEMLNYISRCCSQYNGHALQKFRLNVKFPSADDDRFGRVVSFAIKHRVIDLSLSVYSQDFYYPLKVIAFPKSITRLDLTGLELENISELIRGCPLLDYLRLSDCNKLGDFELNGCMIIKSIKIKNCEGLNRFAMESPILHHLSFWGWPSFCDYLHASSCKSLKVLSLEDVPITDRWIASFLPQLVLLETIKIRECSQLKCFKVSNSTSNSIKNIKLKWCENLESIEVNAINLESFMYRGSEERDYSSTLINISACKHLKKLELSGYSIPKELLQEQLSKFLELDELILSLSNYRGGVEINHQSLRRLRTDYPKFDTIKINTPRLVSFDYCGILGPFYSIHHETTILNATVMIYPKPDMNISYFVKWLRFLHLLSPCKALTLSNCRKEELIVPQHLRDTHSSPLVDLKHMMIVELWEDLDRISTELVDNLLWLSPYLEMLEFVPVNYNQRHLTIKFVYERKINKVDSTMICLDPLTERLSLKAVEMKNWEGHKEKENLLRYFQGKTKLINFK